MDNYLIQFRFRGKARKTIRELINTIAIDCGLHKTRPSRSVPHITFAGPFFTTDEHRLIENFHNLCVNNPLMHFDINGFNTFEKKQVVYLHIEPEWSMVHFRQLLSKTLQSYCSMQPMDYMEAFNFHSTIAMKLTQKEFEQVKLYVNQREKFILKHVIARITLLKNARILREFDFFQRKMFDRTNAKNKMIFSTTMNLLQNYLSNH